MGILGIDLEQLKEHKKSATAFTKSFCQHQEEVNRKWRELDSSWNDYQKLKFTQEYEVMWYLLEKSLTRLEQHRSQVNQLINRIEKQPSCFMRMWTVLEIASSIVSIASGTGIMPNSISHSQALDQGTPPLAACSEDNYFSNISTPPSRLSDEDLLQKQTVLNYESKKRELEREQDTLNTYRNSTNTQNKL